MAVHYAPIQFATANAHMLRNVHKSMNVGFELG
jgi:hypothetical protein